MARSVRIVQVYHPARVEASEAFFPARHVRRVARHARSLELALGGTASLMEHHVELTAAGVCRALQTVPVR